MGKMKKKEMPNWAKTGHRKPVTRREFLAHGIIPFAVSTVLPGALGLLASPFGAHAAEMTGQCPTDQGIIPPFITVSLSGGSALPFLARDVGGNLLSSYSKLGGGGAGDYTQAPEFAVNGQSPFAESSGFLAGLRTGAPTALANTSVITISTKSVDDSPGNEQDFTGLVMKAGLTGSLFANMRGGSANATAVLISPPAALNVRSVADLGNAIGFTAALRNLPGDQKLKITRLVSNLSNSQAKKLNSHPSVQHVRDLVNCAGIKNNELISLNGAPPLPANIQTIWGANSATNIFANMAYHTVSGNGAASTFEMGGYDYHGQSRAQTDGKDGEAGTMVGRILETAKALNRKVAVHVYSDGVMASPESNTAGANYNDDSGAARGFHMLFVFDPAARPALNGFQLGGWTNGQVTDGTTFVGSSCSQAAQAAFANYMKFANRMDLFEKTFPGTNLRGAVLDSVLKL